MATSMDYLFKVMGQLQAALAHLADEDDVKQTLSQLPQIVVLGGQSAGKSTLLESIANLPGFLPKGGGMQTRRPLLLRLQNDCSKQFTVATFQNPHPKTDVMPNSPVSSTELISEYIKAENSYYEGVSSEPIQLTLSGPDLPTVTLVDLPGFTPNKKVRASLPEEIRQMVMDYVKGKDNVLILAVTSAIEDTDNSLAEPFAVEVDPQRLRTIGVYTKMDFAPDLAWSELHQASASKNPNCLGVKLPDNSNKRLRWAQSTKMAEARWQEQNWFDQMLKTKHPDCQGMPNLGVHYLLWRVQKWLVPQINKSLSHLKANMQDGLEQANQELSRMSSVPDPGVPSQIALLINRYCQEVDTKLAALVKLKGAAQYRHMVKKYRLQEIHRDLDERLEYTAAADIIDNARGADEGIADWCEEGCRMLAQQATSSFLQPAKETLDQVEVLIRSLAEEAVKSVQELDPYPLLKEAILQAAAEAVMERSKAASADVATTIAKHQAQIDDSVLKELKRKHEEAVSVRDEVAATMGGSEESGEDVPLVAAFQLKRGAMAKLAELAEQEKKVHRNVELTIHILREYITEHVETKLAFDIPASWRYFMLGSDKAGEKQKEGLLTSDSHRPGCFSKKCFDMAYCSSRHQPANHAKLAAYMDEKPENAIKRKRLADKVAAYEEALEGLARVAAVPALGEFQRLQKPSDIYRIPSGIEVLQGMKQIPTAPEFPVIPEAEPDSSQVDAAALASQSMLTAVSDPADEVLLKSDATSASGSSQPYRGDDRDAIAKCESGFGTTLRGAVWGAEWMAYGAKYALVQSFGLLDKTVATGGCRHGVSPGFDKREQTRDGWLKYKQDPSLSLSEAAHSKGRQVHQDPIKRVPMPGQPTQSQPSTPLIKASR